MHDLRDSIHKHHHVLLQAFRRICELPNVAEPERAFHVTASYQRVQLAMLRVLRNHTGFSEHTVVLATNSRITIHEAAAATAIDKHVCSPAHLHVLRDDRSACLTEPHLQQTNDPTNGTVKQVGLVV